MDTFVQWSSNVVYGIVYYVLLQYYIMLMNTDMNISLKHVVRLYFMGPVMF